MSEHFDTLETRDPELRERAQLAALREQIAYARANAPWFGRTLSGIDAADIDSRAALAALPVVRKAELLELQKADRPFGGFAPADKPRFVIYVVIHHPRGTAFGGTTAGPVFHDLMVAALAKYGVAPTGSRPPNLPIYW